MFEYLGKFNQIIVTGPQRSGTNICAHAISHDLGYELIDERKGNYLLDTDNPNKKTEITEIRSILKINVDRYLKQNRVVLQCPYAACICHQLPEHVAVVFMVRPVEQIIRSQNRINWRGKMLELILLGESYGECCEIKYKNWEWQKHLIKHAFEVRYHDLENHELWVDELSRKNFLPHQVSI